MEKVIHTDPKYWISKRANRKTGFPAATIAHYGVNDESACKVVVGIFDNAEVEDATTLRKWFATEGDIRSDFNTTRQIVEFLQEHRVERIAMVDRIIGCPHDEGIDYPSEGKCPECPFWANRDRFTGELV